MADKSPLQRGTIGWDHFNEQLKQLLRRMTGGGSGGADIRTIISETSAHIANDSITDAQIGLRNPLDDVAPADPAAPALLSNKLGEIVNRIKVLGGTLDWWDDPATDLATLDAFVSALPTFDPVDGFVAWWDAGTLTGADVTDGLRLFDNGTNWELRASGIIAPARAINANLTLTNTMRHVECSTTTAAVTLTLPTRAAANDGLTLPIEDIGRNCATAGRNIILNTDGTDQFLHGAITTVTFNRNGGLWPVRGVFKTDGTTRAWSVHVITEGV